MTYHEFKKDMARKAKIEALAVHGATQGERDAARHKLDSLYPDWDMSDSQLLSELGA